MRKIFLSILMILILQACDDGDIVINDFDFEDQILQSCDNFEFVFFKINPDTNESLALQFSTTTDFIEPDFEFEFNLSGSDQVVYRKFNSNVSADYFCNPIPPSTPSVSEELTSTTGEITITTVGTLADSDGISSETEDPTGIIDTDNDGLPDIIDEDDDGDNVPTFLEGVVLNEDGTIDLENSRDTDADGILDYLDSDDDNDGILTINEDADGDLDPSNDNNDPLSPNLDDYLNPAIANENLIQEYREHQYDFSDIQVSINMELLSFLDENGEPSITIQSSLFLGDFEGTPSQTIVVTPDFN